MSACEQGPFWSGAGREKASRYFKLHAPAYSLDIPHTYNHCGPPSAPSFPWWRRCPGVFHVSLHQREMHAKLFAECARVLGEPVLQKFADELIAAGVTNFATEEMEALTVTNRRSNPQAAFNGPDSLSYMWHVPQLVQRVLDPGDARHLRVGKVLLAGCKAIRAAQKIYLCRDFDAADTETGEPGPGANGPALLRRAAKDLNDWIVELASAENLGLTGMTVDGHSLYTSSFHVMEHICAPHPSASVLG